MDEDTQLVTHLLTMERPLPDHDEIATNINTVRIASVWMLFSIIDCFIFTFTQPASIKRYMIIIGYVNHIGAIAILGQFLWFTLQDLRRIRGPSQGLWNDVKLCFCGDVRIQDILCVFDLVIIYLIHVAYWMCLGFELWSDNDDGNRAWLGIVFAWTFVELTFYAVSCCCWTSHRHEHPTPLLG